jgi:probable phosphoglycerate mutase
MAGGRGEVKGAGRLVVVRHGQTEWSRDGRHTGRTDLPLLPEGEAQARRLEPALAAWTFAVVLTSPLERAVRTAALAGFPDAEHDPDLLEWDYGEYEGTRTADVREHDPGWSIWETEVDGGEQPEQVGERVDRVISRARAVDGDVLAFAHAHVLRILAARWIGLPAGDGCHLVLEPATFSVLGWERETPALRHWNVPPLAELGS